MKRLTSSLFIIFFVFSLSAQNKFNGLDMNMGNLYRLSDAKTRSISSENITGEPGQGGQQFDVALGQRQVAVAVIHAKHAKGVTVQRERQVASTSST